MVTFKVELNKMTIGIIDRYCLSSCALTASRNDEDGTPFGFYSFNGKLYRQMRVLCHFPTCSYRGGRNIGLAYQNASFKSDVGFRILRLIDGSEFYY